MGRRFHFGVDHPTEHPETARPLGKTKKTPIIQLSGYENFIFTFANHSPMT